MPKSKTDFTNFVDARPNYFPGQFLLEDDFEVEQKYLIDRQKYHRQSLHVSGIVEGLEVEVIKDKQEVQIKSGSAINSNGDLIILKKDTSFSKFAPLTNGELYISYKEEKQVKQQEDFTRWQEVPTIGFAATTPNDGVKLAKISIVNNVPTLDLTVRSYSGVFLPNATGNDLTLRSGGDANPNVAILNGSLTVTGTITGKIDATNINSGVLAVERIPNLSANKITSGILTIPGSSGTLLQVGAELGSTANIDLSGHVQLKEYGTGNLAYLQARNDTSNRNIGLRIRTQKQGTTNRELVEALTISPTGNVGIGTETPSEKLEVSGNLKVTGIITGNTIIGNINATNINSGVLAVERIPNLSANKITSGTISGSLTVTDVLKIGQDGTGGTRDWMTRGMSILWDSDNLFIGLKDEGSNRKDAVIAWGDDPQDDLRFIHVASGGAANGTEIMRLKPSGNVGIGTTDPTRGKVHIEGSVNFGNSTGYRYLRRDGVFDNAGVYNAPYSLYANSFIGCQEFNAFSDLRIKEIKGNSNSNADLQTLLQIQVTDYYYKDKIANGNRPKKKVIGQQIAAVYPQAVSTHADIVPDILQFAVIAENWVTLNNHNLKIGDKVKIFWDDNETKLFPVEAIESDKFKISLNYNGDVFAYGREVDDFHVVDYDALSMLHISATQEIYRMIKKMQSEVSELKKQNHLINNV